MIRDSTTALAWVMEEKYGASAVSNEAVTFTLIETESERKQKNASKM